MTFWTKMLSHDWSAKVINCGRDGGNSSISMNHLEWDILRYTGERGVSKENEGKLRE
jgi:hypothetical protein